ncbi:MAG: hypothetical protein Q9217_003968 [Psora testacea]
MRLLSRHPIYIGQPRYGWRIANLRHVSSKVPPNQHTSIVRDGLSYHWDTSPPSHDQLQFAERFFRTGSPKIIDSAIKFRTVKDTTMPEVAFLGRSNVGKSTMLNALMDRKICRVSSQPGRTRTMNFFAVGGDDHVGNPGRLVLLDMPGYGKGSREEWGKEIMKYLAGRKQKLTSVRLRRAFLLINGQHGVKLADEEILYLFRKHGIAHQVILPKVDRILFPKHKVSVEHMEKNLPALDAICTDVKAKIQPGKADGPEALGEIVCCSAETTLGGQRLGIDKLRWAVLAATGLGDVRRKILSSEITFEKPSHLDTNLSTPMSAPKHL